MCGISSQYKSFSNFKATPCQLQTHHLNAEALGDRGRRAPIANSPTPCRPNSDHCPPKARGANQNRKGSKIQSTLSSSDVGTCEHVSTLSSGAMTRQVMSHSCRCKHAMTSRASKSRSTTRTRRVRTSLAAVEAASKFRDILYLGFMAPKVRTSRRTCVGRSSTSRPAVSYQWNRRHKRHILAVWHQNEKRSHAFAKTL